MAIVSLNDLVITHKTNNHPVPHAYFICQAAYNTGIFHGAWVDVSQELTIIQAEINTMLESSPAPNANNWQLYAFNAGTFLIDKNSSLVEIQRIAIFIKERGKLGLALLAHYNDIKHAEEAMLEHYYGRYKTELDFAIDHFYSCYIDSSPSVVQKYIDYTAWQKDLFAENFLSIKIGKKIHVFSKN